MRESALHGRVALVTGASRQKGIGYGIAKRLASLGADLFIQTHIPYDAQQDWGADPEGIAPIMETLRAYGGRVEHSGADFYDPAAPHEIMAAAVRCFRHVDILVVNHTYSTMGALEDLTAGDIDMHMAVNVRASLLLIKAFAAQHDGRPGGRVLLMTSGQHLGAMPAELAYIASKGALHQLTASLSAHLISRGITVNTINPGATDTGYASPELYQQVVDMEPLGRWGEPDDAARLIAWLATDDARWITGQVINSTGGGP